MIDVALHDGQMGLRCRGCTERRFRRKETGYRKEGQGRSVWHIGSKEAGWSLSGTTLQRYQV
jgi:hypothetical protein